MKYKVFVDKNKCLSISRAFYWIFWNFTLNPLIQFIIKRKKLDWRQILWPRVKARTTRKQIEWERKERWTYYRSIKTNSFTTMDLQYVNDEITILFKINFHTDESDRIS